MSTRQDSLVNQDLSSARECPLKYVSSKSGLIESGVASSLLLRRAQDIDFVAELLLNVPRNRISDMQNGLNDVELQLKRVSTIDDKNEVKETQQVVISLLNCILKVLNVEGYSWVVGEDIPTNTGLQDELKPLTPRVFCFRSSQPDIMLQKEDGYGDMIGPVGEVKRAAVLSDPETDQFELCARQAALCGISFIKRVYPMLHADVVSKIFGSEWYIYVPLLSHKSLYILRVGFQYIYKNGAMEIQCSELFSGHDMAVMLASWVLWALQVQRRLVDLSSDIQKPRASYCWIPPKLVQQMLEDVKVSQLVARPSFCNPLYIDTEKKRIYKLQSIWSGNSIVKYFQLLYDKKLCDGWSIKGSSCLLSMPMYQGGDLHSHPPTDISQLNSVLSQLVDLLSYMGSEHQMCHCDIRAANICWANKGKIVLIDYDLAASFKSASQKSVKARDSPPEGDVFHNYDLWLTGVMVLQWTSKNFTWDLIRRRKSELSKHKDLYALNTDDMVRSIDYKIVENCLQLYQNRWSLQDLKTYLSSL
ncbi:hypothetical protein MP228_009801 [Amoeboaphelidium protococcarum]|nr:hypothetical protein MP228_009801 [Amoeboaphelidium protococcarum]